MSDRDNPSLKTVRLTRDGKLSDIHGNPITTIKDPVTGVDFYCRPDGSVWAINSKVDSEPEREPSALRLASAVALLFLGLLLVLVVTA